MEDKIKTIMGREMLSAFGLPNVEAEVITENGIRGKALAPRGSSVGEYEAKQIFDGEERYLGYGVQKAVKNVNEVIAPKLIGTNVCNQRIIDEILIDIDGTNNKSHLGANATLPISLASAVAGAKVSQLPLYQYLGGIEVDGIPVPMATVIEGGKYSSTRTLSFEDYLIIPVEFDNFKVALEAMVNIYLILGEMLKDRAYVSNHGAYNLMGKLKTSDVFEILLKAVNRAGYEDRVYLGLDVAGSELYDDNKNKYLIDEKYLSPNEVIKYFKKLQDNYPLIYIEDPFEENDFKSFAQITSKLTGIYIVGDDLFASNKDRVKKGLKYNSTNAVLLKVNQTGTLTETRETADYALKKNQDIIVSIRSRDTIDTLVADFAVGVKAPLIKFGPPIRAERTLKYNRLVEIENELGKNSLYLGEEILNRIRF